MLPIVAAGNSGPAAGTMSPLGYGNCVIAVGCYDGSISGREKKCCEVYSGRGPVDSSIRKPDIVAPGTGILS